MNATWILVADSARARLFEADGAGALNELACYTNPEGRAGTRGLTTDRPPTVNESVGFARHAIEPHTSPRAKASNSFARLLREVLDQGQHMRRFEQLVLVAPPRFLGALHTTFGKRLRECVVAEIPNDFTQLSPAKLHAQLSARVREQHS
jgi:protein required for attachment to host cells